MILTMRLQKIAITMPAITSAPPSVRPAMSPPFASRRAHTPLSECSKPVPTIHPHPSAMGSGTRTRASLDSRGCELARALAAYEDVAGDARQDLRDFPGTRPWTESETAVGKLRPGVPLDPARLFRPVALAGLVHPAVRGCPVDPAPWWALRSCRAGLTLLVPGDLVRTGGTGRLDFGVEQSDRGHALERPRLRRVRDARRVCPVRRRDRRPANTDDDHRDQGETGSGAIVQAYVVCASP
jgi:hypothetical protein